MTMIDGQILKYHKPTSIKHVVDGWPSEETSQSDDGIKRREVKLKYMYHPILLIIYFEKYSMWKRHGAAGEAAFSLSGGVLKIVTTENAHTTPTSVRPNGNFSYARRHTRSSKTKTTTAFLFIFFWLRIEPVRSKRERSKTIQYTDSRVVPAAAAAVNVFARFRRSADVFVFIIFLPSPCLHVIVFVRPTWRVSQRFTGK